MRLPPRWFVLLLLISLGSFGCRPFLPVPVQPPPDRAGSTGELVILAAASLSDAFAELAAGFEQSHPGLKVVVSYASSSQLAQQLVNGAPGDVFASANERQMQVVTAEGRIRQDEVREFASNMLVVALPMDNPGSISSLADLTSPGVKVLLAAKDVPAGQYALEFLEKASTPDALGTDYQQRVLANVVSYENTVRAVLTKVSLGEADAGIVYASDVLSTDVITIDIAEEFNARALYYIAPVRDAKQPSLAADFIDLVLSDEGQQVLARHGLLPPG